MYASIYVSLCSGEIVTFFSETGQRGVDKEIGRDYLSSRFTGIGKVKIRPRSDVSGEDGVFVA